MSISTNILHRIKAHLYDNPLTENPNDFVARVSSEHSLSVRQVAEAATSRGGADIPVASMTHAVELWLQEMGYQLCDGFSINTEWFTVSVHIKGVFDSPTDHFDPAKHTVVFEFHQGAKLLKERATVTVDMLGVAESGIVISQVKDIKTGSVNDLLTPGHNLKITGQKIKVAGNKPGVGILFRSMDDPEAVTRVDPSDIVTNNPSEVMILIPQLLKDTYKLEITTQFTAGNHVLNEPRTAVFDKILEVK